MRSVIIFTAIFYKYTEEVGQMCIVLILLQRNMFYRETSVQCGVHYLHVLLPNLSENSL